MTKVTFDMSISLDGAAGLVDELSIHAVPSTVQAPNAAHVKFRVPHP